MSLKNELFHEQSEIQIRQPGSDLEQLMEMPDGEEDSSQKPV